MIQKHKITASLTLAISTLTNAMECDSPQQGNSSEIIEQNTIQSGMELKPIKFILPKDIYRQFLLECPTKSRIRMRSVNKFTRDAVDKAHESGKYLEELVFELVLYPPSHPCKV